MMHESTRTGQDTTLGKEDGRVETATVSTTQTQWKAPPHWLPPTFQSLAYRNFVFLWLGQMSNSLSLWMDMIARPALVIAMTGSAVQLGLIALARGLPMTLLAPFAGVLADRFDRRLLMLISKGTSLVLNVAFAVLIVTGTVEMWHVYVTAILKSLANAFDQPARQALLPAMVPPRLLVNAVALNQGSMQMVRILAASVAGFLIAGWAFAFSFEDKDPRAFGGVYLVGAITYVIAVTATYLLRVPPEGRVARTAEPWLATMMEGFRFAWRRPVIIGILALFGVLALFAMPYNQVFVPWLALEVMKIGAEGMGLLMALSGVGSLVGALFLATFGTRLRHRGIIILVGMVLMGFALVGLGLTSVLPVSVVWGATIALLPAVMIILIGLGQTTMNTLKNAILFEITPNEVRGRVFSIQSLDRGFTTLGGSVAGFTIALIGGPLAVVVFGALMIAGTMGVGAKVSALRRVD